MNKVRVMATGAWVVGGLLSVVTAYAYKELTHEQISSHAIDNTGLSPGCASGGRCVLTELGLVYNVDEKKQKFQNQVKENTDINLKPGTKTIRELIVDGTKYEDAGSRPLNHFFDPIKDAASQDAALVTTCPPNVILPSHTSSPNWELEDFGSVAGQDFSYAHARQYLDNAIRAPNAVTPPGAEHVPADADRKKNWGLLFQTLGHVLHHAQDMAQPQHVRNDAHLDMHRPRCCSQSLYESYSQAVRVTIPYIDGV